MKIKFTLSVLECKRDVHGRAYMGLQNTTRVGSPCRPWAESSLEQDADFPERNKTAARNFCRNPNADAKGLWCYISESDIEYCDVDFCGKTSLCLLIRYM